MEAELLWLLWRQRWCVINSFSLWSSQGGSKGQETLNPKIKIFELRSFWSYRVCTVCTACKKLQFKRELLFAQIPFLPIKPNATAQREIENTILQSMRTNSMESSLSFCEQICLNRLHVTSIRHTEVAAKVYSQETLASGSHPMK